jgi:addiction module RelB/DinJ family antitoxin
MKTQINLKVDIAIKTKAQQVAKDLGLSLSSIVNASLNQFAKTGEFSVSVMPRMTPYLENLVKEARKDFYGGRTSGPFRTAKDFVKHLNS